MVSTAADPQSSRAKLRAFLEKFIRNKAFRDDDNIFQAGFVNSMFVMQLILYVEKTFGLTVENDELEIKNFASIDAMCEFIARKLRVPSAQAS